MIIYYHHRYTYKEIAMFFLSDEAKILFTENVTDKLIAYISWILQNFNKNKTTLTLIKLPLKFILSNKKQFKIITETGWRDIDLFVHLSRTRLTLIWFSIDTIVRTRSKLNGTTRAATAFKQKKKNKIPQVESSDSEVTNINMFSFSVKNRTRN